MKYTRYDLKSKKRKNDDWKTTLMMILAVVVLALLIGSLIFFKVFPKNDKIKQDNQQTQENIDNLNSNKPTEDNDILPVVPDEKEQVSEESKVTNATESTTYIVVQCGYFSAKESAESVKNKIGEQAKILTEKDKFRVVSYIGTKEEQAKKISDKFTNEEIENTKVRFELPADTIIDKAIIEMINGILDITNKLNESDVTSVKSDEFKAWTNQLKEVNEDAKKDNFIKMKKMINELPTEVTKKEKEKIYQTIYDILSDYK